MSEEGEPVDYKLDGTQWHKHSR